MDGIKSQLCEQSGATRSIQRKQHSALVSVRYGHFSAARFNQFVQLSRSFHLVLTACGWMQRGGGCSPLAGRRRAAQCLSSHMALSRSADAPLVVRARCPRVVGFWCAPDESCDMPDFEMGEERTHDRIYIKRKGRGSEKKWPTREDVLDSGRSRPAYTHSHSISPSERRSGKSYCSGFLSFFFKITFFVAY